MKELKLILGTVQFGLNYGIANRSGKPSKERAAEILRRAADLGIRTLDTSNDYGDSEKVIGEIFAADPALRKCFRIITKTGHVPAGAGREEAEKFLLANVESSLANLRTDFVDGILIHRETDAVHLPFLRKLCEKGTAGFTGLSVDGCLPPETALADAVQIPGNVLDHRFLPFPEAFSSKRLFVRSVYLQGFLLMPEEKIPSFLLPLLPFRKKAEAAASEAGIAPSELYMRYLFSFPGVEGVLTGVDNVSQLEANAACADRGPLPDDLFRHLQEMIPLLPEELIRPSRWKRD